MEILGSEGSVAASGNLVSVVIPAYNSGRTLGETLTSVRRQSYAQLEIVVVNDGSTDDTVAIARAHAAEDTRIRIVSIGNGGVAVARNAGIAASHGAFVAPVDADDLWHPEKIARQMAVMRAEGPETGYVYTLDRKIDRESRVFSTRGESLFEGHVYLRHLLFNFVGNGSSLLIRRAALEEVGGYEPDLHRRGAQGCEDYLLQLLIARSWKVGRVPEYLTGYRLTPGAMSSDKERMARSRYVMLEHVGRRFPETPTSLLAASEAMVRARMAVHLLHRRRPVAAATEAWRALALDASAASMTGWIIARSTALGILQRQISKLVPRPVTSNPLFLAMDPSADRQPAMMPLLGRRIAALAERETAFFMTRPAACPRRTYDHGLGLAGSNEHWMLP